MKYIEWSVNWMIQNGSSNYATNFMSPIRAILKKVACKDTSKIFGAKADK